MEKSAMTIFHINWLETGFQQPMSQLTAPMEGFEVWTSNEGGECFLGPKKKQHVWGVRIS